MSSQLDRTVTDLAEAMAEPLPAPASGAAIAATAALAAALVGKAARLARDAALADLIADCDALRMETAQFVTDDEAAFEAVLTARRRGAGVAAAWQVAAAVPLALATRCAKLAEQAADVAERCSASVAGDARCAALLARACAAAGLMLAELDLEPAGGATPELQQQIDDLRARLVVERGGDDVGRRQASEKPGPSGDA